MAYQEAIRYLESFVNYEKKDTYDYGKAFKLDRMKALAKSLNNPQDSIRSIHIAGTKGKGSTCAIVSSILKEAGYKTGLYISPHLVSFRERIRINDSIISPEDIVRITGRIKKAVEDIAPDRPSFFEVITAIAYIYFFENTVDFAVYETGLGGRLDATNIITPLVSAITPISYEHTDKLGSTLKEIAKEKSGIIKENVTCVSSPQEDEAMDVIESICKAKNSSLVKVGRDVLFNTAKVSCEEQIFDVTGRTGEYRNLVLKLLGSHQVVNASCAIAIVESLRLQGISISDEALRRGIAACKWPGRIEVIRKNPYIILDGAQNRASARALSLSVRDLFKYNKLILVLGVSKDKDIKGITDELKPISDSVVLTKSRVASRACEPEEIRKHIKVEKKIVITTNVKEALRKAMEIALPDDLILVTGSLFVVGEAMEILNPDIYADR